MFRLVALAHPSAATTQAAEGETTLEISRRLANHALALALLAEKIERDAADGMKPGQATA
jgi:hypothetical protein